MSLGQCCLYLTESGLIPLHFCRDRLWLLWTSRNLNHHFFALANIFQFLVIYQELTVDFPKISCSFFSKRDRRECSPGNDFQHRQYTVQNDERNDSCWASDTCILCWDFPLPPHIIPFRASISLLYDIVSYYINMSSPIEPMGWLKLKLES